MLMEGTDSYRTTHSRAEYCFSPPQSLLLYLVPCRQDRDYIHKTRFRIVLDVVSSISLREQQFNRTHLDTVSSSGPGIVTHTSSLEDITLNHTVLAIIVSYKPDNFPVPSQYIPPGQYFPNAKRPSIPSQRLPVQVPKNTISSESK